MMDFRKRKWLVTAIREEEFDKYEEFTVRHDYLKLDNPNVQVLSEFIL